MIFREAGDLVLIDSGLPCDTFNFVCRARLDRHAAGERSREAVEYFAKARRPFSWWVGPRGPSREPRRRSGQGRPRARRDGAGDDDGSRRAPAPRFRAGGPSHRPGRLEVRPRRFRPSQRGQLDPAGSSGASVLRARGRSPARSRLPALALRGLRRRHRGGDLGADRGRWSRRSLQHRHAREPPQTGLRERPDAPASPRRAEGGHEKAVLQAAADGVGIYERVGFRKFGNITEYKPRLEDA